MTTDSPDEDATIHDGFDPQPSIVGPESNPPPDVAPSGDDQTILDDDVTILRDDLTIQGNNSASRRSEIPHAASLDIDDMLRTVPAVPIASETRGDWATKVAKGAMILLLLVAAFFAGVWWGDRADQPEPTSSSQGFDQVALKLIALPHSACFTAQTHYQV